MDNDMCYIITEGEYSDYHIVTVFQTKEKAELYQKCHPGTEIEEYYFDDDRIFTCFDTVEVTCYLYYTLFDEPDVRFKFKQYTEEDDPWAKMDRTWCNSFDRDDLMFGFRRKLPNRWHENEIKQKYMKVVQDIIAEMKYEFGEISFPTVLRNSDKITDWLLQHLDTNLEST